MLDETHTQKSITVTLSTKWRMALQPSATDSLATDDHGRTIGPSEGKTWWEIRLWYDTWYAWENVVNNGGRTHLSR